MNVKIELEISEDWTEADEQGIQDWFIGELHQLIASEMPKVVIDSMSVEVKNMKKDWDYENRPQMISPMDMQLLARYLVIRDNAFNLEEQLEHLAGQCIAVFPNYVTDGPGYVGKLISIIWGGGPEMFEVIGITECKQCDVYIVETMNPEITDRTEHKVRLEAE